MSISIAKPEAAALATSVPVSTWISLASVFMVATGFYFQHTQKSTDDAANLAAQTLALQTRMAIDERDIADIRALLAKIDGKTDILIEAQKPNQKQK